VFRVLLVFLCDASPDHARQDGRDGSTLQLSTISSGLCSQLRNLLEQLPAKCTRHLVDAEVLGVYRATVIMSLREAREK